MAKLASYRYSPQEVASMKQRRTTKLWLLLTAVILVGGGILCASLSSGSGGYTGAEWDTKAPDNANGAATVQAKADCEIAWSLEKGGPSTYGVSHSDYITACVRSTP